MFLFSLLSSVAQDDYVMWDYPVKPGTEAWKGLETSQEIVDTCQIPQQILPYLSTTDLADICLNYPLISEMLLSGNYQDGFEKMSIHFNGFRELSNRKDAGLALLELYEEFDLTSFNNENNVNPFYDMCIDVVIAQPEFLNKLGEDDQTRLINESLNKLKIRKELGNSTYRQKTTAALLSRLLTKNGIVVNGSVKEEYDKHLLLEEYFILEDEKIINEVIELAKYFE